MSWTSPPGHNLPRTPQPVEKRPLCTLSPQIGHQIRRFWGCSSPICGRNELNADFFNRLTPSRHFVNKGKRKGHHLGTNEAPEGLRWENPPGLGNAQIVVGYLTSQFFGCGSAIVSFSGDVSVGMMNVG